MLVQTLAPPYSWFYHDVIPKKFIFENPMWFFVHLLAWLLDQSYQISYRFSRSCELAPLWSNGALVWWDLAMSVGDFAVSPTDSLIHSLIPTDLLSPVKFTALLLLFVFSGLGKYLYQFLSSRENFEISFVWNRTRSVLEEANVPTNLILESLEDVETRWAVCATGAIYLFPLGD